MQSAVLHSFPDALQLSANCQCSPQSPRVNRALLTTGQSPVLLPGTLPSLPSSIYHPQTALQWVPPRGSPPRQTGRDQSQAHGVAQGQCLPSMSEASAFAK